MKIDDLRREKIIFHRVFERMHIELEKEKDSVLDNKSIIDTSYAARDR